MLSPLAAGVGSVVSSVRGVSRASVILVVVWEVPVGYNTSVESGVGGGPTGALRTRGRSRRDRKRSRRSGPYPLWVHRRVSFFASRGLPPQDCPRIGYLLEVGAEVLRETGEELVVYSLGADEGDLVVVRGVVLSLHDQREQRAGCDGVAGL